MKQPGTESSAEARAGVVRFRVASYNIHRSIGTDGRCDPERVAAVIRELGCDPVGLQEVDNTPGAAPTSMQLEYLERATGMTAVAGLRLVSHLGHYGNALLTRRPVISVRRHDLSVTRYEPRGALDVELEIDGRLVRFVTTHLGLSPGERRKQMQRLLTILASTPEDEPLVLLGDINEWWPHGRPLRWLHAIFGRPPTAPSFPARLPFLSLDRIWARPRESLRRVTAIRTPLSRLASDHLPVAGEVEISARAPVPVSPAPARSATRAG
jgi:endonuclease/exonuclease/phosphatase family metal-dependent hydrolase